jgi:D-alanyl-D-alanine carboxypeptidase (penicillin-binding protein 5/6)
MWLNLKSAALGAYSASFHNPHGLPAAGHAISAAHLAQITRYALANDFFAATVAQKSVNIGSGASRRHLQNTNKLLWHDEDVNGVKTGTTNEAGACLVGSLKSGGAEFVGVVFNSRDRYGDCLRLLRYGAAAYKTAPLFGEAEPAAYVPVRQGREAGVLLAAGGEVWCCYARAEAAGLRLRWDIPETLAAPVSKGQHVGSLRVFNAAGEELANVPLIAAHSVEAVPASWWRKFLKRI